VALGSDGYWSNLVKKKVSVDLVQHARRPPEVQEFMRSKALRSMRSMRGGFNFSLDNALFLLGVAA
jgi:hypothetical protein